jgi:cyanosortase A-associated protein
VYSILGLLSLVVLVKLWAYPEWGVRDIRPIDLPAELRISDWELTQWDKLQISPDEQPRPHTPRQYHYTSDGIVAHVEGRSYEELNVELDNHVAKVMNLDGAGEVRSLGDSGWSLVRTEEGRAMLDVCLDAQGRATATSEQFAANRSWQDNTVNKVLQGVLGRVPVHDSRCLWIHISLPEGGMNQEEAYQRLADLMQNWRSAWLSELELN